MHTEVRTAEDCARALERFCKAVAIPLDSHVSSLTGEAVEKYVRLCQAEGRKAGSIKVTVARARSVFSRKMRVRYRRLGIKLPDLCEFLEEPLPEVELERWIPLSPETEKAIREEALSYRYSAPGLFVATFLMLDCGMMPDEVIHARKSWLERPKDRWKIRIEPRDDWTPKSRNRHRSIVVPNELQETLLAADDYFVPGDSYTARYNLVKRGNNEWLKKHGANNYALRKQAGSNLLTAGKSLEYVARFLGNSPAVCWKFYADIVEDLEGATA